jgi:hypothetical protein
MASNAGSLRPSPVPKRREREEDDFQKEASDKENSKTLIEAPVPSQASNLFMETLRNGLDKKKKPKKKKVEVEVSSDDEDKDKDKPSYGYKKPPLPNAKDAAEADFVKETEEIAEQQQQYNLHLANLRTQYLDSSSEFMRSETPRVTRLIAEEDYMSIIEDSGQISDIHDRARKYAETLSIKFRSARGIQHQRNDAEMSQKSVEKMMQRIGKQLLQLLSTTGDLLMMATEKGDCMARITYMTQVSPQWSVFYDMLMDRAEQWIFYTYVIKLLDTSIKLFKEQATKQKIKHEMDALDIGESDLETSSSSSEDDDDDSDEDEESSSDDGDSDAAVEEEDE